jgi:2-dehydro-3-deoxy-D-arabinonate dehydratase
MKLHNTSAGILLEQAGHFCLETSLTWDELINHERLHTWLAQRHAQLPRYEDAGRLLAEALLPPMQGQELWCSGVTYLRSKVERQEEAKEAGGGDFYQRVYEAARPELFFKANLHRVVGHRGKVRIRADSSWNVPEPELTLVINRRGDIVGYTIGNDMSSRSIEGENPLYLPQAKTYDGCAAVGPCVYVTAAPFPTSAVITLVIARGGVTAFSGNIEVNKITRTFEELASYLFRECTFPQGALLMTGTGIVPPAPFTLHSGDEITIAIDNIGTLVNSVA